LSKIKKEVMMKIWTRVNLTISFIVGLRLIRVVFIYSKIVLEKRTNPRRFEPSDPADPAFPVVSVIIPAWEEAAMLKLTLARLIKIDYPVWEAFVVAGGRDRTFEIAAEFQKNNPNFKVIKQLPKGKNAAINQALPYVRGEVVVLLDADCLVNSDWLTELVQPLMNGYDAACSNFFPVVHSQVSQYFEFEKVFWYELKAENVLHGNAIALRRELLARLGGMDETVKVGVDWDLDRQVLQLGGRRKFVKASQVQTPLPATPGQFLKNEIRWRRARLAILVRSRNTTAGLCFVRAFLPYLSSITLVSTALVMPATCLFPALRKIGWQLLWLWLSLLVWLVLQPVLRALAVTFYTGQLRWLSSCLSGPLLAILSSITDVWAVLTPSRKSAFFKGPRPVINPES
jgi:cellulose synthase/poly-beta-1,6-N-acetylglucosamine synthase-like glycosyltransferase